MDVKVLGIIVVFYDRYTNDAISNFSNFIKSIDKNGFIIVVNNSEKEIDKLKIVNYHLDGDNRAREFSGWDKAIRWASLNGYLDKTKITIFANDTFCHHNRFGFVSKILFRNAFSRMISESVKYQYVGEMHSLGARYLVGNLPGKNWISTYLFALKSSSVKSLGWLFPDDMGHSYDGQLPEEIFEKWRIDDNLSNHILSWLGIGGVTNARWYGSNAVINKNHIGLSGKINSILAEKLLAARCEERGIEIVNIFNSFLKKNIRKFDRKPKIGK